MINYQLDDRALITVKNIKDLHDILALLGHQFDRNSLYLNPGTYLSESSGTLVNISDMNTSWIANALENLMSQAIAKFIQTKNHRDLLVTTDPSGMSYQLMAELLKR